MKRIIPIFAALVLAVAIPIQSANAKQSKGTETLKPKSPTQSHGKHLAKRQANNLAKRHAKKHEAKLAKKQARKQAAKLARNQAL